MNSRYALLLASLSLSLSSCSFIQENNLIYYFENFIFNFIVIEFHLDLYFFAVALFYFSSRIPLHFYFTFSLSITLHLYLQWATHSSCPYTAYTGTDSNLVLFTFHLENFYFNRCIYLLLKKGRKNKTEKCN